MNETTHNIIIYTKDLKILNKIKSFFRKRHMLVEGGYLVISNYTEIQVFLYENNIKGQLENKSKTLSWLLIDKK